MFIIFLFILTTKFFFKNLFKIYLSKYLNKLNKLIKKSSYEYLILIRIVFGIPLIVQNLFISTLDISKTKFFLSSLIGFSPYFLFFTFLGDKISNLIEIKDFSLVNILSIELVFIVIILIFLILFRIINKINSK